MTVITKRFTENPLNPYYPRPHSPRISVRLAPGTYLRGTILGEVKTTAATATANGGNTGNGTFATPLYTAPATLPGSYLATFTDATHYSVTDPAGNLVGTGVAGTAFVGASGSIYQGFSITFTVGSTAMVATDYFTIVIPAFGYFKAYNNGNTDGTQVAKCILPYDVTVDLLDNQGLSPTVASGEHGATEQSIGCYFEGEFQYADLVGYNAALVSTFLRFIKGDATNNTGAIVTLL